MKFAVLNLVLFLGVGVVAAQNNKSATGNDGNNPKATNVQSVRGCLSETGNTYALLGGNPLRQYRITGGDLDALKDQIGHTVQITGPVGQVRSGASTNGMYGPGSTTGVGYDTIKAESVQEVASNCG